MSMDIQSIKQPINQTLVQTREKQPIIPASKEQIVKENIEEIVKRNPAYIPNVAEKALIHAIEEANKKIAGPDTTFEISIHEKTKEIMIKVLNSDTKELIREIPSEKILDMVASMCEAAGIFVDEKR